MVGSCAEGASHVKVEGEGGNHASKTRAHELLIHETDFEVGYRSRKFGLKKSNSVEQATCTGIFSLRIAEKDFLAKIRQL